MQFEIDFYLFFQSDFQWKESCPYISKMLLEQIGKISV